MIKDDGGGLYTSVHEGTTSVSQGSQASNPNGGESDQCAGVHSGSDDTLIVAGAHVNENTSLQGFPDEDVAVFECQASFCLLDRVHVLVQYPTHQRIDTMKLSRACARRAQYSDVPLQ